MDLRGHKAEGIISDELPVCPVCQTAILHGGLPDPYCTHKTHSRIAAVAESMSLDLSSESEDIRNCGNCRYFEVFRKALAPEQGEPDAGYCHRYPTAYQKNSTEWCGEHRKQGGS